MAQPNFQYEKRQKDLAKKKKREEKLQQKALKNAAKMTEENPPAPVEDEADSAPK